MSSVLTPKLVCRAAGASDSAVLKALLADHAGSSLSLVDIVNMRDPSGKLPVHHAAWRGSIESVERLLSVAGGDHVNAISTGQGNYGKTPIFFAITRDRAPMVDYLLRRGASVRIINNKGQSPVSLGASHFGADVVEAIRRREEGEGDAQWQNFRESHSDGRVYGDLDPRFFKERPLLPSDVVTPLSVNPTTRESRRRRNAAFSGGTSTSKQGGAAEGEGEEARAAAGGSARVAADKSVEPAGGMRSPASVFGRPSPDQEVQLAAAWAVLEDEAAATAGQEKQQAEPGPCLQALALRPLLLDIIRIYQECKFQWLPGAAQKLRDLSLPPSILLSAAAASAAAPVSGTTVGEGKAAAGEEGAEKSLPSRRLDGLLQRLVMHACSDSPSLPSGRPEKQQQVVVVGATAAAAAATTAALGEERDASPASTGRRMNTRVRRTLSVVGASNVLAAAASSGAASAAPSSPSPVVMPTSCVWVADLDGLQRLKDQIVEDAAAAAASSCAADSAGGLAVSIDTEWADDLTAVHPGIGGTSEGKEGVVSTTVVATVQIATSPSQAWVIDALPVSSSTSYKEEEEEEEEEEEGKEAAVAAASPISLGSATYHDALRRFLEWLWVDSGCCILGFSLRNDVTKLRRQFSPLLVLGENCVDLQALAIKEGCGRRGQPAGLATAVSTFLGRDLEKGEQRSDWSLRPLSASQLQYAALDAAVLHSLLAAMRYEVLPVPPSTVGSSAASQQT